MFVLTEKLKRVGKSKRSDHVSEKNVKLEKLAEVDSEKVDEISSVDEDCTRGMKSMLLFIFGFDHILIYNFSVIYMLSANFLYKRDHVYPMRN